jgi:hypothetical protein
LTIKAHQSVETVSKIVNSSMGCNSNIAEGVASPYSLCRIEAECGSVVNFLL